MNAEIARTKLHNFAFLQKGLLYKATKIEKLSVFVKIIVAF